MVARAVQRPSVCIKRPPGQASTFQSASRNADTLHHAVIIIDVSRPKAGGLNSRRLFLSRASASMAGAGTVNHMLAVCRFAAGDAAAAVIRSLPEQFTDDVSAQVERDPTCDKLGRTC
jgi:hypothetical protein